MAVRASREVVFDAPPDAILDALADVATERLRQRVMG